MNGKVTARLMPDLPCRAEMRQRGVGAWAARRLRWRTAPGCAGCKRRVSDAQCHAGWEVSRPWCGRRGVKMACCDGLDYYMYNCTVLQC